MAKCNYSKCDFRLYREICGKLLNDNTVKSLIMKRKTALIKGFKNKDGKTFDARLILDENSHTKFDFSSKC
jgi:DNA topoisomerase-3